MNEVRVGVGVIIRKDNAILLGLRTGSFESGKWACPGGHFEFGESFEECCIREVLEETDLRIKNIRPFTFTNDILNEDRHYVTLMFEAEYDSGELTLKEPDRCKEWIWHPIHEEFPEPLFTNLNGVLQNYRKKLIG